MAFTHFQLGSSIPSVSHAVSVSLPTFKDTSGYASGERRVIDAMVTGYPRFFVHMSIRKLASICLEGFRTGSGDRCILVPSESIAGRCRAYLNHRSSLDGGKPIHVRLERFSLGQDTTVHVVLFPVEAALLAKQLWQNSGVGISSRYAEHCLSLLQEFQIETPPHTSNGTHAPGYLWPPCEMEQAGAKAKAILRSRIAEMNTSFGHTIQPDDVFCFPSGMSAIWHTHQLFLALEPEAKSVCFGFLYTDTLKILERWGPGCYFFGRGTDDDLDSLEKLLEEGPRPSALFTEAPTNPLLRTPDFPRLRSLADRYGFSIVVDSTVGSLNVNVLPWADVAVSSLTKIFSGEANTMGGSIILNPESKSYDALKARLSTSFEDVWFSQDAVVMERNSRDLARRMKVIDANALVLCDYLYSQSVRGGGTKGPLREVFYPKWSTPEHYQRCCTPGGGFGGLFSLTFTKDVAAHAFFDALECAKGPSLGTNFTLACAYTILAHSVELEFAAEYGVEEGLVRVSVGMEDVDEVLLPTFKRALGAAVEALAHVEGVQ